MDDDEGDPVSLYYSEPDYFPGKNVYGEIKLLAPLKLSDLIYCQNNISGYFLKLQWKGCTVYQRSLQPTEDDLEGEWIALCRNTWDSVLNDIYLEFKVKIYFGLE